MSRWMLLSVLLLVPLGGHAQHVYKCKAQDGSTAYQSRPCENGAPEKTWDAGQYEVSPQRQAEIDRNRRAAEAYVAVRRSGPAAQYSSTGRSSTAEQGRHARCEAAKLRRDRALEALGLRRTHADLRRWGDYVYERCKP